MQVEQILENYIFLVYPFMYIVNNFMCIECISEKFKNTSDKQKTVYIACMLLESRDTYGRYYLGQNCPRIDDTK